MGLVIAKAKVIKYGIPDCRLLIKLVLLFDDNFQNVDVRSLVIDRGGTPWFAPPVN